VGRAARLAQQQVAAAQAGRLLVRRHLRGKRGRVRGVEGDWD
jgi:hypothetical protein